MPSQATVFDAENALDQIIAIVHFIRLTTSLYDAMAGVRSGLLAKIRSLINPANTADLLKYVCTNIQDDLVLSKKPLDRRNQRACAVKVSITWAQKDGRY